jgi:hypothetical protein
MRAMRLGPLRIVTTVSVVMLAALFAMITSACDQLNRPMSTSSSSSSSSSGGASATGGDAGDNEAGPPAPAISAQPGDIQL